VDAFLKGRISFPALSAVVEETLARVPVRQPASVAEVLAIDEESRKVARQVAESAAVNACSAV
jgi:1-deoxy-D-xylulose-5-phosphate reductoisomerase